MLELVTNTVEPQQVRETDTAYVIEDVPFVRPMQLSGGYVPEQSIRETANDWADVPATLNHPRDGSGRPVAADTKPGTHLGTIESPTFDGEFVRGDIRVNKARLAEVGGEARDIRQALENGEPFDVSSQYRAEDLDPGEYDGEHRSNVERIVEPDSVALLPNKSGVCSLEDGCGINPAMVANAEVSLTVADDPEGEDAADDGTMEANQVEYDLTSVDPEDVDSYTDDEWDAGEVEASLPNPSEDADAADVLDQVYALLPSDEGARDSKSNWKAPFRSGPDAPVNTRALVAIKAAASGGRGGFDDVDASLLDDLDAWANEHLESADAELFGAGKDAEMEDNSLVSQVVNALADVWHRGETRGAEPPADADADESPDTGDDSMSERIEDLVANHGFEEENLPAEDTECFDRIYEKFVTNSEADPDPDPDEQTDMSDNAITFESEEDFEEYVESIVANRREQDTKEELATEVVANSNEYDDPEAVLEDYPTVAALETKKEQVAEPAGAAIPGTGADLSSNDGDPSDFPSPIASQRAAQIEGDD